MIKHVCLTAEQVVGFIDEELPEHARKKAMAHLADCLACCKWILSVRNALDSIPQSEIERRAADLKAELSGSGGFEDDSE